MTAEIMVYDLKGNALKPMSKATAHQAYHDAISSGEPQPHKHEHIGALLFDGEGRLLTQIRSPLASENSNQTDKSLGGHIKAGYTDSAALMEVATREYRIPIAVVSKKELTEIVTKHPELIRRQAFVTEVDCIDDHESERVITKTGKSYNEICTQKIYTGVFDGPYKAHDEGTALRPFSLKNLQDLIDLHPKLMTGDLRYFVDEYQRDLKRTSDLVKKPEDNQKVKELLHKYSMKGRFEGTIPRKEAHGPIREAYLKGKQQPNKHQHIAGMLVGGEGQIFAQIRAENKAENPGMFDKIVGGHIPAGDSPIVAGYHEFLEEMRIPVAVYGELEWENILDLFPDATKYQAICRDPTLIRDFTSVRFRADGETFVEISDQYVMTGFYEGDFGFTDKEASGIFQFPSRTELVREMLADPLHKLMVKEYEHESSEHNGKPNLVFNEPSKVVEAMKTEPGKFTQDLRQMVDLYWDELVPLEERFK